MCALLHALAEQMEYMAPPRTQQETEFLTVLAHCYSMMRLF